MRLEKENSWQAHQHPLSPVKPTEPLPQKVEDTPVTDMTPHNRSLTILAQYSHLKEEPFSRSLLKEMIGSCELKMVVTLESQTPLVLVTTP